MSLSYWMTHRHEKKRATGAPTITVRPASGSNWTEVSAGILHPSARLTACGVTIEPKTYGVAHPSLPCGTQIFVAYGNTQVLTEVIDRGPYVPGRELDLTTALAAKLGVTGVTEVRWRFAG